MIERQAGSGWVWTVDPFTCETDELRDLTPNMTVVDGRATYDADGRLA